MLSLVFSDVVSAAVLLANVTTGVLEASGREWRWRLYGFVSDR